MSSSSSGGNHPNVGFDSLLDIDKDKQAAFREAKPWMKDPKYFKTVHVSASAAMRMMQHSISGCEQGMKVGAQPKEVMGLLVGTINPDLPTELIISDAIPLPVEGAETRVIADDQDVLNFMIGVGESLGRTRAEHYVGWYHSHPFDVDVNSHCFLSSTDLSTQLAWQLAEDRQGNPWLAIVVDPLRSLAKGKPELMSFRAFPPNFNSTSNEMPDGKVSTDDKSRVERWGSCWNRYYSLETKFYMTSLGASVLGLVSKNYLWAAGLQTTPVLEKENKDRFADRVNGLSEKLSVGLDERAWWKITKDDSSGLVQKSAQIATELSIEQLQGHVSQVAKHVLFATPRSSDT